MTAPRCTAEPVSWLRLERYALGETGTAEAASIAGHVEGCAACRSALASLDEPIDLRPLPAAGPARGWFERWRQYWLGAGAVTLAAAAAVLLIVLRPGRPAPPDRPAPPPARVAVKGGELAIDLVREHGGSTATDPSRFLEDDRFKVLVTCPPGHRQVDVMIEQDGQRGFPLAAQGLACGNRIALDGAFRITGSWAPVTVCAIAPDRGRADRVLLRVTPLPKLANAVCVTVRYAR
ncbi:MAG TPA: hypothetical protein VML75_05255 [Kofleriaceae bacterium]|nr:hypothetical protein [Kofleriaceae bacterium]